MRTSNNEKKSISKEYIDAFSALKKELTQKRKDEQKWKKYSKGITEKLKGLLKQIAIELYTKSVNFSLGRSVIKLNSLYTSTRISIPFVGTYKGDVKWEKEQENWMEILIPEDNDSNNEGDKSDSIELMYRNPEKPVHLLTELMWRFQTHDDDDDDLCLAVSRNNDNFKFKNIKNCDKFKILFTDEVNKDRLNKLKNTNPKIPIRDYTDEDVGSLLKPVNDFFNNDTIGDFNTIFYIADITETDYMAGFEFEIIPNSESEGDSDELYNFIKEIRWYFSKYVAELINSVERLYVGSGMVYKDNFFSDGALNSFITALEASDSEIEVFKNVLDRVRGHFIVANSEIGQYWIGYKHWSYEVARTTARIIDYLFPDDSQYKIETIIQEAGIGMDGLNKAFEAKGVPHVFRQLFRGFERERELFIVSQYRDHFIHSFYVFVMGLLFLKTKSSNILPSSLICVSESDSGNNEKMKVILKKWFIVAMCHDIAYVLEKGEYILEKYILNFMVNPKRKKNVLQWVPRLGNLMQIERLLDNIHDITKESVISLDPIFSSIEIRNRDIIIPIAFQHINHGIWSSLFVYHSLDNKQIKLLFNVKNTGKGKKVGKEEIILEEQYRLPICRAILPHHISQWDIKKLMGDFDNDYFSKNKPKDGKYASINPEKNPLGYLLSLCDTLCQAGREAPELSYDSFNPSSLNIKYGNVEISDKNISIDINYHFDENKKNAQEIHKSFYEEPLKFITLKGVNSEVTNYDLKVKINVDNITEPDVRYYKISK